MAIDHLKKSLGIDEDAARAYVARWMFEAPGGPSQVNSTGHAGIAQWSQSRQAAQGGLPGTLEEQLQFAERELLTSERASLEAMKKARTDAERAAAAAKFERAEGYQESGGRTDVGVNPTLQIMRSMKSKIPDVDTGASGSAPATGNVDKSTNTTNSSENNVNIHSMNVTTPDPDAFAKGLQPALAAHAFPAQANYGIV